MEPMGSITGDNYENDRHVLLNQTTDENIAVFESLYGPQAAQQEFAREQPQMLMPQKSLSNPAYNRPGEPQGRLSPAEHYSRQGTQQPRMQDSRNTAFLETGLGNIDDDDLAALIMAPDQENRMNFDANYGQGAAQYFLEQEQSGYEVGSESQMHMRGPFSSETLGPQGRLYGNTPATMQQPKPLPNHQAMPSTMQPRLRPPVLEHEPNALSKLAPRR